MLKKITPFVLLLLCLVSQGRSISPFQYGLSQARTGEERYNVLYRTHVAAIAAGCDVDYSGITSLDLAIPTRSQSIPLTANTDFKGVVFNVVNTKRNNFYLFTMTRNLTPVRVNKSSFSTYEFSSSQLKNGLKLLIVQDDRPWVANREGYSYGATRKDVLLLEDGKALNETVYTYDNKYTSPSCSYTAVTSSPKSILNATLNRSTTSTYKVFFVKVENENNVEIGGITIRTPEPITMNGDVAITIFNCANVYCHDITIDGTYSFTDKYGYGISMDNVYNSKFVNINGKGNWGVFGNNNINTSLVEDSNINRFDVHCYGRDFTFRRCNFSGSGVPMSSFFGELRFEDCNFTYAKAAAMRPDYNAHTPYDIYFSGCTFKLSKRQNNIIHLANLTSAINSRAELARKNIPNISIKDCSVQLDPDVTAWELVHVGNLEYPNTIDNLSSIVIDGLVARGADADFYLFDKEIKTTLPCDVSISGLDILQEEDSKIKQATVKYVNRPCLWVNLNYGGAQTKVSVNSSRLNYNPAENPHHDMVFNDCTLGRLRYYNTGNGELTKRRSFNNCRLYLNSCDASNYLIDSNADYVGCTFIPCDKNMKMVPQTMEKGSYATFENCKSTVRNLLQIDGASSDNALKDSRYDANAKKITRKNGSAMR